jgi:radical SAM protein with 4Fe4S-binding SPASM domain
MQPLSVPIYYSLEVTSLCNSRCPVCSNVFVRRRETLSAAGWTRVLAHLAPHAETFKLTGGEATLHPEFPAILRATAETGVPFALFTNGRWRDPDAVIDLLLHAPTCSGLLVSLHGADTVTHEAFTQTPGSFVETCANIQAATAAGLRIHTSTVITQHNWCSSDEIITLAKELGASRAVFNRYLGPPAPAIEPEPVQLRFAVQRIEQQMHHYAGLQRNSFDIRYGNCIPHCFTPSSSAGCWAGIAYCTVDPWGNLRPCNHSPTIVGNLFEAPINALWQSDIMEQWRALTPSGCVACTAFDLCHGGCRALVELRESDPLIGHALAESTRVPQLVRLPQALCPLLTCTVRSELFGYSLARGHSLFEATHEAAPLLDQLKGDRTLQHLTDEFGADGLEFIGLLYLSGMVSLIG